MSASWAAHGGPPPEAFARSALPRNTPGLGGYLAAVLIAYAWNALFLGAPMGPTGWAAVFVYECMLGPFVAVPGVLVLHLACRGIRAQWVHVVVAAGAGLVLTVGWFGLLSGFPLAGGVLAISVSVSAALGRLAVVPSVHRRQGRFASRSPLRVP